MRASAARRSGLSMSKGSRSSVFGAPPSSRNSRAKTGELKVRSVSQVQAFFKERTLSKADAYIRDRSSSEGHIFLKALAPDAPFLQVMAIPGLSILKLPEELSLVPLKFLHPGFELL